MGLIINRASIGVKLEPEWNRENGSRVFTAGDPIVNTGTRIWVPPDASRVALIRWFSAWSDVDDTFVADSGATTIAVGNINATSRCIPATAISGFASRIQPVNNAFLSNGYVDALYVFEVGVLPGRPLLNQDLRAFCDTGTITGTMRFTFDWKYIT